ncbi:ABC transporter permease [Devriesea agamarum]|uniref:ABC transporter permease n=1 Tax=Devriesea agamarum TaxID=472569 RepID=UPI00071CF61D|nr:ABC transporter permease [Devriesea agamarum]
MGHAEKDMVITGNPRGRVAKAWLRQFRNQFLCFLREPAAAVFNVLVPLFIVTIEAISFGETEAIGSSIPGLRVVDTLPAMAGVMFVMIIGLFGMSVGLSSMMESRTLAGYSLRPGGIWLVISSYAAALLCIVALGMGISIAVLMVFWNALPPAHIVTGIGMLLLSACLFLLVGAVIAGLTPSPRSAQGICSAIFFPLLFLSGAIFPLDSFPSGIQLVSKILPGHHVAELLYAAWLDNQPFPWLPFVYVLVLIAVATGLTAVVYRRREDV